MRSTNLGFEVKVSTAALGTNQRRRGQEESPREKQRQQHQQAHGGGVFSVLAVQYVDDEDSLVPVRYRYVHTVPVPRT